MVIKRIGVIGAGQMGSGIAHVCALKGFGIRLMDVDPAAPQLGRREYRPKHGSPDRPRHDPARG